MTAQSDVRPETLAQCAQRGLRRLRNAIPADGAGLVVMEPATHLFISGAIDDLPEASCTPFFTFEMSEAPRTFRRMAIERAAAGAADAESSPDDPLVRDVLVPHGFGADLRAVCSAGQAAWGGVALWRAAGAPPFTLAEADRLQALSAEVGEELRDAVVGSLSETLPGAGSGALGLLVLDRGVVAESSPEAATLLLALDHGRPDEIHHLNHLRALSSGPVPFTTVLRTDEGWITAHGARLGPHRVAITLSATGPERLFGARVLAAGLSAREIEVTRLICRGLSDREIARHLGVSDHTAHDHVRAVRRKLGVRSRAEVAATIFAEHYFEGFQSTVAITRSS
jgi:DNA-binding CsgD family transcriptional regulator